MKTAMKIIIYHNPKCSKSRQTLALLQERGLQPEIIKYLETPPSAQQLKKICQFLDVEPKDIIRFKEPTAKDAGLKKDDDRTSTQWLEIMANQPTLIERPIVVVEDLGAAIGRPPEAVLNLIDKII